MNCLLNQHRASKCPILYSSARDTTHDRHHRQALLLQDRDRHLGGTTTTHRVFPQVWQVYHSQGHGEADGSCHERVL